MSEPAMEMAAAASGGARHVKRRGETRRRRRRGAARPRAPKLTPARLIEAVGAEVAARLMRTFGGRTIPKVSPEREQHSQRHGAVRIRAARDGYAAAAAEFGLSIRQVRRIVHGY